MAALSRWARGYLSKRLSAADLVESLLAIHDGEIVVSAAHITQKRSNNR